MHKAMMSALGLAAIVGLASGCAREVSAGDIEDSIREQAQTQGFPLESVDCPEGLPPEPGATIICEVVITGEVEIVPGQPEVVDRFRVEVRGVDGGQARYSMTPLTRTMTG